MGIAEILSAPPLILLLLTPAGASHFPRLAGLALLLGLMATQTGPIVRSCLQNVVAPRARASAFAVFAIFDDLGKGGGPWIIARMVRAFGRRRAFVLATALGWCVGGLVNLCVALTLEADERKLRAGAGGDAGFELVPVTAKPDVDVGSEVVEHDDETTSALHRRGHV